MEIKTTRDIIKDNVQEPYRYNLNNRFKKWVAVDEIKEYIFYNWGNNAESVIEHLLRKLKGK